MSGLATLGWNSQWEARREASQTHVARIVAEFRGQCRVSAGETPFLARLAGRFRGLPSEQAPVIGDWVSLSADGKTIEAVLPRQSELIRKAAGRRQAKQVLCANLDVAWLLMGLDDDYNLARLARYATLVQSSGAKFAIVLTKADVALAHDSREIAQFYPNTPVYRIDARNSESVEPVYQSLAAGQTAVLLGSSGIGKSTLTNTLLGRIEQRTNQVRDYDQRGQHTTTRRQLFILPSGALLVDTPGLRELALDDETTANSFSDIAELATLCQFGDCQHRHEPNCAVAAAVAAGELSAERLANFHKIETRGGSRLHRR